MLFIEEKIVFEEGDLVYVDFGEIQEDNHKQFGFRPAVVLCNNVVMRECDTSVVQVIPITSANKLKNVHIKINEGLEKPSFAIPEQITTIDKRQIRKFCGTVSTEVMNKLKKAIYFQLGLKLKEC